MWHRARPHLHYNCRLWRKSPFALNGWCWGVYLCAFQHYSLWALWRSEWQYRESSFWFDTIYTTRPTTDATTFQLDQVRYQEFSKDLKLYFQTFGEDARSRWGEKTALEFLRAIVLSGDASNVSMAELRHAFTGILPEYQHEYRMTLDPNFVYAFGAAQRARHIIQNPDFLRPGSQPFTLGTPNNHAELWDFG